ncbi:endoribonuclease Dicer-like, partial [Aphis craccivora]
ILVITAQLFLSNLQNGNMDINDANLLIFDECQHAVALHPFKQIMQVFHESDLKIDERPHILGLTTSLINSNIKNVKDELIELQTTFNTCPEELISSYDEFILDDGLKAVIEKISKTLTHLFFLKPLLDNQIQKIGGINYLEYERRSNKLPNVLFEIMANLIECGPYIAHLTTSYFLVEIEKINKVIWYYLGKCSVFVWVASEIAIIQSMLYDYMCIHNHGNRSTISNDLSPKLVQLMQHLSTLKDTDACLIFVNRQTNAKMLYKYIQECINIKACNVVITFDPIITFASYTQSKAMTQSSDSKFIIMVPNQLDFKQTQSEYIKKEEEINKIMGDNDIDEENMTLSFKTKHAVLTHGNATKIINNYCLSLPQDRFSTLCPEWYIAQSTNELTKYKLILPINSVIKTPIDGLFCKNKKNAKKSAAYNACIELYKAGALNEYLVPMDIKDNATFNDLKWFPHWDENDIEASKCNFKAGTKKMKRIVDIENTKHLHGSFPIENKPSYLHVIHCTPYYTKRIESKYEAFDKLLKSNKEYGILTSNKLPQVSRFPIFLPSGNVIVSIKVNVDIIFLDSESLKELDNFHNKLFVDILGEHRCTARQYDNEKNSYLVVPIFSTDNIYKLDWDIIKINKLVETEKPTMEQRNSKFYKEDLNEFSVISPWYRSSIPTHRYIVTDIFSDMTPESSFPSLDYETYAQYFKEKYNIDITHNDQPLLQVKSLNVTKTNFLVPRISTKKNYKRSEYIEILIPELCIWHKFPSVYWFKALMLPTILYRLEKLLLAEELIVKMNSIFNIKVEDNATNTDDTLNIDNFCGNEQNKTKKSRMAISKALKYSRKNMVDEWNLDNLTKDIDKEEHTILLNALNNNNSESSNNITNVQQSNASSLNEMEMEDLLKNALIEINPLILSNNAPPILNPLFKEASKYYTGLNQSDILKILTPVFCNDIFNYERNKIYGDSFLKFAVSLVLYDAFQSDNVKVLTGLKTKIIGNQNLFYVGRNLNLGSYLMLNEYNTNMNWIPPCFGVSQQIIKIIEENNCSLEALHQIILPRGDQITGMLSDKTLTKIKEDTSKFNKYLPLDITNITNKDNLPHFGCSLINLLTYKQTVPDETVADSVKSLIGTYVFKYGVEIGFKVLHGLGVIPFIPKEFNETFNHKPIKNVYIDLKISNILPGYELLEQRIGYSFKNKHLLTQALIHPTYHLGSIDCFQRLEFLGDAILDFLITSYIIQHCNDTTPDEITDIRSSLVNNITFSSLSTRIGLHRFILAKSLEMTEAIDRFYKIQQKNNHKIWQEVLYLIEENDCREVKSIDVPKVLGDLFKALIAAIYLDCNRDLNFVWTICYKLMENEINEFCTYIPKNPIRILQDTGLWPNFSKPDAADESLNKGLGIMRNLQIKFKTKYLNTYGFGQSKKEAKVAAAKIALKNLKTIL